MGFVLLFLVVALGAVVAWKLFIASLFGIKGNGIAKWEAEWRFVMAVMGLVMAFVTTFAAITAWRVREVLRSELSGWESLLLAIREEFRGMSPKGQRVRMLCYSPNAGDISLRHDEAVHGRAYMPFKGEFLRFVRDCGTFELICYPDSSIHDMLLGLRAYAQKRQDTYRLIQEFEGLLTCTVWRMERVPPQHFLIIGSRVGYRFLVTAEAAKGVHDVRAIRSEDGDEVNYMNKVWESSSSALALPKRGEIGFWVILQDDGGAALWGHFQDQTGALEIQVQVSDGPNFRDDMPYCKFSWEPDGRFLGKIGSGNVLGMQHEPRPPSCFYGYFQQWMAGEVSRLTTRTAGYFRIRIVKGKVRPDTKKQFMTEWSRPLRPFLPSTRIVPLKSEQEKSLMCALKWRAELSVDEALTRISQIRIDWQ